jgi:hypothetical protein
VVSNQEGNRTAHQPRFVLFDHLESGPFASLWCEIIFNYKSKKGGTSEMKKRLLAGLATGLFLVGMVGMAGAAPVQWLGTVRLAFG